MENSNIDRLQKRPHHYWFSDGLAEIVMGWTFILVAAGQYLNVLLARVSDIASKFGAILLMILVIGGVIAARWLVQYLKMRITYPRTGYMSLPKQPARKRWLGAVLGFILGSGFAIFFIQYGDRLGEHWSTVGLAITLAVVMMIAANKSDTPRLFILSVAAAIGCIVAVAITASAELGTAVVLAVVGIVSQVTGFTTLKHYLANTKPLGGETDQS